MTPRLWLPLVILLALAGCRDAAAPLTEISMLGQLVSAPTEPTEMHILQQSPTAPPLETYQVSFWARKNRASTVSVNYLPGAGQSVGDAFLRFDLPGDGLLAYRGTRFHWNDSIVVTLTIDPVDLSVDFQPSGLTFAQRSPASLTIWYGNANPDLNDDGVVDAADGALEQQLSLWYNVGERHTPWFKLSSARDTTQPFVVTTLYHFSEYAVSW